MEKIFYVCATVYSILGSFYFIFLIIFLLFVYMRMRSIVRNAVTISNNISVTSEYIREKIKEFSAGYIIKSIIDKKERKKDD